MVMVLNTKQKTETFNLSDIFFPYIDVGLVHLQRATIPKPYIFNVTCNILTTDKIQQTEVGSHIKQPDEMSLQTSVCILCASDMPIRESLTCDGSCFPL